MPAPYTGFTVDRHGNIFVITLQRGPENRLNSSTCQELIRAFHDIQRELGPGSEGAVITRGSNAKCFCTGLDLDEGETTPFANSDGFYPVYIFLFEHEFF